MNILIDCYHPANYLLLRRTAAELTELGHKIVFAGRKKDVLIDLLTDDHVNFFLPESKSSSKIRELVKRSKALNKFIVQQKIDLSIGATPSAALSALGTRAKSIVFNDDDPKVIPQFVLSAYPAANLVLTPDVVPSFPARNLKKYPSYHTLAYLHPEIYSPTNEIFRYLGLEEGEDFSLIRCVKLSAFHDKHAIGISREQLRLLIKLLERNGRVYLSMEESDSEFEKYFLPTPKKLIHSVLYYAKVFISDSQSMTSEAAVLGTPSIRINSFFGKISYLKDIEARNLSYGFHPKNFDNAIAQIESLLNPTFDDLVFSQNHQRLLSEKINPVNFFLEQIFAMRQ
jgi:uncharacterized protein